ncbi:MAG TPA: Na+/H+ antiporter NhaA [Candidatus Angelobacter sp.]
MNWRQIFGASRLCGIGFTMSLFIAALAFGKGELLDLAKIGILAGSILAGIAGSVMLGRTQTMRERQQILWVNANRTSARAIKV